MGALRLHLGGLGLGHLLKEELKEDLKEELKEDLNEQLKEDLQEQLKEHLKEQLEEHLPICKGAQGPHQLSCPMGCSLRPSHPSLSHLLVQAPHVAPQLAL